MLDKARRYSENSLARAAIQSIPIVGTSIDTLLAGEGLAYEKQRVESFFMNLNERMQTFEQEFGKVKLKPTEELYDLLKQIVCHVMNTRSENKRKQFAAIIENRCRTNASWEEAEMAAKMLNGLSDLHIQVLSCIANAKPAESEHYHGSVVARLNDIKVDKYSVILENEFSQVPFHQVKAAVVDLVSLGLLREIRLARIGMTSSNEEVGKTDSTDWFLEWITNSNEKPNISS